MSSKAPKFLPALLYHLVRIFTIVGAQAGAAKQLVKLEMPAH